MEVIDGKLRTHYSSGHLLTNQQEENFGAYIASIDG
jgi:hypothetical protein